MQRKPRTVESYQREVAVQKEQVRQCQQENAQLRASQDKTEGLRGLVSAGLMGERDKSGVAVENLFHPRRYTVRKGSALKAKGVWSYRSNTRVAVELWLQLLTGEQPWVAEGATLVDAHGREVPVLPLWQAAPIALGFFQSVVVEAEATEKDTQGPYTLKVLLRPWFPVETTLQLPKAQRHSSSRSHGRPGKALESRAGTTGRAHPPGARHSTRAARTSSSVYSRPAVVKGPVFWMSHAEVPGGM